MIYKVITVYELVKAEMMISLFLSNIKYYLRYVHCFIRYNAWNSLLIQ